jgi:hypothetical protein
MSATKENLHDLIEHNTRPIYTKQQYEDMMLLCVEIGYFDRDAKLQLFNNAQTRKEKLDYIANSIKLLYPEEYELDRISSVS